MRRHLTLLIIGVVGNVALLGAQASPPETGDGIVGTWVGTWDGDGTGEYTMSIVSEAANELGGTVETMPDSGAGGYTATFTSIVVDGAKVSLKYDTPDGGEVQLEATIEGTDLEGTWKAFNPGTMALLASGMFTGSKR